MRSARTVWVVATVVGVLGLASSASSKSGAGVSEGSTSSPGAVPSAKGAPPKPPTDPRVSTKQKVPHDPEGPKVPAAMPGRAESAVPGPLGPGPGQGARRVSHRPSSETAAKAASAPPVSERTSRRHKIGHAPKQPSPTLPLGVPEAHPDDEARRLIAGGPVDDVAITKSDPELEELSQAERVLFPKPLVGAKTGWSWDLPAPTDDEDTPTVEATGLPSSLPLVSGESDTAAKEAAWLRSLTMPNLPTRLDERVVKYLEFYRDDPRGKSILRTWVKKCGRLVPALKAELAKAGLPTDLVWLSLIESGHNPTIVSRAGAAGLWQFIPESARMYGLTVDRWVDERLDPERSTEAAVRYLADLRARFGSWDLAMAAYNMGHGGLLRAVRKFNTNDFWALSRYEAGLPWETTLYVPKILATAIVMANKKAFGLDDVEEDPPMSFDTVSVNPNVELASIARAADVPLPDVVSLNPQYLTGRTPPPGSAPRTWPVRVPSGRGLLAEQRLAEEPRHEGRLLEPLTVKFGDTLASIAAEHDTTVRELSQANHISQDERLSPGSVLLIVPSASGTLREPAEEEVVIVPSRRFVEPSRKRVFYRVIEGDSASDVAAEFGVALSDVVRWNALDESAHLQPGMTLQIYVRPAADLSRVRYLPERDARVLIAGTEEFFDYFEGQDGRKRMTVVAKKGDTLASVGKRYGMSTGMMERVNRISARKAVSPGEKLVVYAKTEVESSGASPRDLARELSAIDAPFPDALPSATADLPTSDLRDALPRGVAPLH